MSHTLQSCLQSDGSRRYATPPQQIAAFNRRSQPEVLGNSGGDWVKVEGDVVIGNDVMRSLSLKFTISLQLISIKYKSTRVFLGWLR